jgi:translation initiation factor IF-1
MSWIIKGIVAKHTSGLEFEFNCDGAVKNIARMPGSIPRRELPMYIREAEEAYQQQTQSVPATE